jgi:mannose-6-phosphate isomerase-like protein (cupin superfamily)
MHQIALPALPDVTAPDGSHVRILCALERGSMAHFTLAPGMVSKAVRHRSVEEIWYIIAGTGQMWRTNADGESIVDLHPGLSLTIPAGASFQFRSDGPPDLEAVAITMPPWPGMDEAQFVDGKW